MAFDLAIFNFIHQLAGKYLILDWLGIFFAVYFPYLLIALFIFLLFWKLEKVKQFYYLLISILSLIVARGFIVSGVRFFFPRPRPFLALEFEPLVKHIASASFPSSHATIFFVLAALTYFINRKFFPYFLGGAIIIAIARVFVGVHWPSDVLAGAVVGVLVVLLVKNLIPKVPIGT